MTMSLMTTTQGERRVYYEWEIDYPEWPSIEAWGRVVRFALLHIRKIEAWKKFGCFALRQLKRKRLFGHLGQFLKTIKDRGRSVEVAEPADPAVQVQMTVQSFQVQRPIRTLIVPCCSSF